jgi:hypothetical protein
LKNQPLAPFLDRIYSIYRIVLAGSLWQVSADQSVSEMSRLISENDGAAIAIAQQWLILQEAKPA